MKYRRCGNSGLLLPEISLGLWHNFGDVDDFDNCKKMLFTAFDLGITHFDLGNNYGPPPGSAEINFGKILTSDLKKYRDELIISTKAGYQMWPGPYGEWGSRKYLLASLDQSLERTGLDYFDIFYSHRPDPDTPLEETMSALDSAVKQGKALYAGISSYDPEQTAKAAQILEQLGTKCLIHQPSYSMLNRNIEEGLLDTLEDYQIGCIAFCPLSQGLLTDKYLKQIPQGSRAAKEHGFLKKETITNEVITKIDKLNKLAKKRNQSLAQMALAWILKDARITSVLIGASKPQQIIENVDSLKNTEFSAEPLAEIDNILNL
jgi:L-glyceraldehyde 3-phosphate reductase